PRAKWRSCSSAWGSVVATCLTPPTLSEMGKCCRNMLDTADIVRDACFRQVTRPSDLCTIFPRKNSSACQFFIDFHAFNEWRAAGGYAARVMEPATESILGVVMRRPILAS